MNIVLASRLGGHGGVAVYNRTLGRALANLGHSVSIVTSADGPSGLREEIEDDGLRVYRLGTRLNGILRRLPGFRYFSRSLNHFSYSRDLARFLLNDPPMGRPDVVEFAEVGGEAFHYLRHPERSPVVVRCHTPTFVLREHHTRPEMPYDTSVVVAMERSVIRRADVLTTPSEDMADVVAREVGVARTKVHAIPNAVPRSSDMIGAEDSISHEYGIPDSSPIVLHVGRLERIKGVEVLADAIPAVLAVDRDAHFVFIGAPRRAPDGRPWSEVMDERFEAAGVHDRVHILNYVDDRDMACWYRRADIAVVPSLNYESFSYTCAQAMSYSIPVVATAIGGMPETLDYGRCGLLVPLHDAAELGKAIVRLLRSSDERKKMGRAGFDRVDKTFKAETVACRMLERYEEAIRLRR